MENCSELKLISQVLISIEGKKSDIRHIELHENYNETNRHTCRRVNLNFT